MTQSLYRHSTRLIKNENISHSNMLMMQATYHAIYSNSLNQPPTYYIFKLYSVLLLLLLLSAAIRFDSHTASPYF